ncbi:MAG: hypothetical protein ACXWDN_05735 [Limisphaerales bacterium]
MRHPRFFTPPECGWLSEHEARSWLWREANGGMLAGAMTTTALLIPWILYALAAVVLFAPIFIFIKRKIRWGPWPLLALIFPYWAWFLTMVVMMRAFDEKVRAYHLDAWPQEKRIGNLLIEPLLIALAAAIIAFVRTRLHWREDCRVGATAILFWLLCLIAVIIALITPNLGGTM